jgi:hypothetical protein
MKKEENEKRKNYFIHTISNTLNVENFIQDIQMKVNKIEQEKI